MRESQVLKNETQTRRYMRLIINDVSFDKYLKMLKKKIIYFIQFGIVYLTSGVFKARLFKIGGSLCIKKK